MRRERGACQCPAPTPVSAIEIDLHRLCDGFPGFSHFVDKKTWNSFHVTTDVATNSIETANLRAPRPKNEEPHPFRRPHPGCPMHPSPTVGDVPPQAARWGRAGGRPAAQPYSSRPGRRRRRSVQVGSRRTTPAPTLALTPAHPRPSGLSVLSNFVLRASDFLPKFVLYIRRAPLRHKDYGNGTPLPVRGR